MFKEILIYTISKVEYNRVSPYKLIMKMLRLRLLIDWQQISQYHKDMA